MRSCAILCGIALKPETIMKTIIILMAVAFALPVGSIIVMTVHPQQDLVADYLAHSDEEVMQALATGGALAALADGRVEAVERDELVNFIDRRRLVPTISRHDIAEAFDNRVRQLEDRDRVHVIVE